MAGLRALSCLLIVVAIGCGGGGDDEPPRATVTPTPTVDDATLAKRAALRLDDFPSGWTATETDEAPADCELISAAEKLASARDVSPRFNRAPTTVVQNEILVYRDEATAEKAFALFSAPKMRSCFSETVTGALPAGLGVELGEPTSAELSTPQQGDAHTAARITVPASAQGIDVEVTIDVVVVRTGRALSVNLFVDVPAPFDAKLRDQLTAASVDRLAAVPG